MKYREDLGLTVMTIFYEVDPTDVKKLSGGFGSVFKKTCVGKSKEDIKKWRQALEQVSQIAGYHSRKWDNEASMIEKVATKVSNMLNNSTSSSDFHDFVGMKGHMGMIEYLLIRGSGEVRLIGILGMSGIGKTTIAKYVYHQIRHQFETSVFMDNIKERYPRPCYDDHSAKLQLRKEFLSQTFNQNEIEVPNLGVAQDRLKDERVLAILDDVNHSAQLDATAKETWWFGTGSLIIITTQDRKLLKAHGIKQIYEVNLPSDDEALQIFCMNAFGQKSPYEGFNKLSREVTKLAGGLPLGLKVMGTYFRRMSKKEWKNALPRLRTSLDGEIQSILQFGYEALSYEDKYLFLHIACFFNCETTTSLETFLVHGFSNVRQGLQVLAEKSLISINRSGFVMIQNLLVQLGREIVCTQSFHDPGQRLFLNDAKDIYEVLTNGYGSRNVIGIDLILDEIEDEFSVSEQLFEGMYNLQFLRIHHVLGNRRDKLYFPHGLNCLPRRLRLLHWEDFPMTRMPSKFQSEFLVKLVMQESKLEKFWEGIQPLKNLNWMDMSDSRNLKELPDLSTATNLQKLVLCNCSSLVELPSSIENATSIVYINLMGCSSLVELPSCIGNLTDLSFLNLSYCSSLVKLPSFIGNAISKLTTLYLKGCSSLVELPSSIWNVRSLQDLYLSECVSLVEYPHIENAANLVKMNPNSRLSMRTWYYTMRSHYKLDLSDCSRLVKLPSYTGTFERLTKLTLKRCSKLEALPENINLLYLDELDLTDCSLLTSFPEISTNIKLLKINGTAIEEVPSSIRSWSNLSEFHMSYFENLKKFPHALESITVLYLSDTNIKEVAPWVKRISRLRRLVLNRCRNLISLTLFADSLCNLDAENCESL